MPADGITGQPWTESEIELTIVAYFEMLEMQLAGHGFTKTEIVRRLQHSIPVRNARAIEAKFQNVSAVLDEAGIGWIDGYIPLAHYQHALKDAVLQTLQRETGVREAIAAYESATLPAPSTRRQATEDVLVPVPHDRSIGRRGTRVLLTGGRMSALHDFRARQLGSAGERWVVDIEREALRRAGREDLAQRVRWIAHDVGDGLGFDVESYRIDGRARAIEVKTTNYGPRTPFFITRWELEFSRTHSDTYSLYRVHGFARDPRIYILDGNVEERARLDAAVFLGMPIG